VAAGFLGDGEKDMTSTRVTFIIVTRNSRAFMPSCLDSLLGQTYRDFQIVVIDNDSSDGTAEFVRRNYPMISVIENNKNLGFAKANNQGIRLFKSPFLILCNPDIVLEPSWLERIIAMAESAEGQKYQIFGGKLLKLNWVNIEVGEMEKTSVIDSCGLKVLKNHRVVELFAGEESQRIIDRQEVFGHSGALTMFRREALEQAALTDKYHSQGDYFDGTFFFYKEDVDLAWRLRLLGLRSLLLPQAVAYHLRTFPGSDKQNISKLINNRSRQSRIAKYYSYRNHLLILLEDEFLSNLLIFAPQIFWLEFKKFIYLLFFETANLYAWVEVIKLLPEIRAKRKAILGSGKLTAVEIRKWFN
jgi:GT2 family glycosyltransferase